MCGLLCVTLYICLYTSRWKTRLFLSWNFDRFIRVNAGELVRQCKNINASLKVKPPISPYHHHPRYPHLRHQPHPTTTALPPPSSLSPSPPPPTSPHSPGRRLVGGHSDCILALVEAGADVNLSDVKAQTPLFIAIASNNLECARILLQAGREKR